MLQRLTLQTWPLKNITILVLFNFTQLYFHYFHIFILKVTKSFFTSIGIANDSHAQSILFYHFIDGGGSKANITLNQQGIIVMFKSTGRVLVQAE
jgi:hypothetical protein